METVTEPDRGRTVRIRAYLSRVYDVKQTYYAGADVQGPCCAR
jgi:hypothetical protein